MKDQTTYEDAKAAILHYIENRLQMWAAWFTRKERLVKGYSPVTIEYRLMTEGHIPNEYYGLRPLPTNELAEEIERLVKDLYEQNQKLAEVLRAYYLRRGTLRDKARRIGTSQTRFEVYLNSARWWLASRLTLDLEVSELIHYFKLLKKRKN